MKEITIRGLLSLVAAAEDHYYYEGPQCTCPQCAVYRRLLRDHGYEPSGGVPEHNVMLKALRAEMVNGKS